MCQEKSALISFFLFIIFLLTFAHCSYMLLTMETKTVKTYMRGAASAAAWDAARAEARGAQNTRLTELVEAAMRGV